MIDALVHFILSFYKYFFLYIGTMLALSFIVDIATRNNPREATFVWRTINISAWLLLPPQLIVLILFLPICPFKKGFFNKLAKCFKLVFKTLFGNHTWLLNHLLKQ